MLWNNQSLALQNHVPSFQVWAIAQVIVDILGPIVQLCVLNQSRGPSSFLMP
jgi:hypothetical protein